MKSVGKQLQEARLARNWTPELAARETKIKVDRVLDLEADEYTHFSSPTYARGFVRTYARALGLDEYKILRQLDTKLPEDETSSFGPDSGIPYVPEPSKPGQTGSGVNPGLYVVLSLGMGVLLVISFILFEAYRAGVLPSYFAENSPTEQTAAPTTNGAPATAESEAPAPRAKPVDPNAAPPPITAESGDTNAPTVATADTNAPIQSVRALPVDLNALNAPTSATPAANAPFQAVRALPVDPSQLTNATPPMADGSQPATATPLSPPTDDGTNAPIQAVRALPVDPNELAAASAPGAAVPAADATNDPSAQTPTAPNISTAARLSNSGPVHMPPAPVPAAPPAQAAMTTTTNDAPQATATTDTSADKRLVLTASRDSFVRVTSEDVPGTEKVLYASVIHTGQSVGFDGHKFSINVGIPSAVDITLDGVNYGPHSDQEAPETFTVESHQP
ncbi:MAG: helix-turn-helix domain-containing protein [Methylacidiphilales bacterium]|nr:helix-turn-helix domain-containing protein [Candidatus Methylacidiphilales bacterium]